MRVIPDAQVVRADPAIGGHSRCFCQNCSGMTNGAAPKVYKVPLSGKAILRRVLAHGRNKNAVLQLEFAQAKRFE